VRDYGKTLRRLTRSTIAASGRSSIIRGLLPSLMVEILADGTPRRSRLSILTSPKSLSEALRLRATCAEMRLSARRPRCVLASLLSCS